MQELYFYLFGWCSNDIEMMFSLFIFMFIVCTFFNMMAEMIRDTKGGI